MDSSILGLLVSDIGGVFFDIVGVWESEFSALIKIDEKESQFKND